MIKTIAPLLALIGLFTRDAVNAANQRGYEEAYKEDTKYLDAMDTAVQQMQKRLAVTNVDLRDTKEHNASLKETNAHLRREIEFLRGTVIPNLETQVTSDMGGDVTPEYSDVEVDVYVGKTGSSEIAAHSKSQVSPQAATIIPPSEALLEAFRS